MGSAEIAGQKGYRQRRTGALTGTRQAERELERRFAAGDVDVVRELYARYAGAVFTVAMSRLHDPHLAEEAVQEVFLKAWRAASGFDAERELRPWLYEIARRTAADIARRERRRPVTTTRSAAPPAAEWASLDDTLEAWEVRCALGDLPATDRELLRLTHYVGLTRFQIANRLGIPIGTVKSRVHRAHRRLAERLAHLHPAS